MLRFLEKHQRFVYKIFVCYFVIFSMMGECYADVSESQLYGDHYKKEEANKDNVRTDYYAPPVKVNEGSYTQDELSAIDTATPGSDSNIVAPDGSKVQNQTFIGENDTQRKTFIYNHLTDNNRENIQTTPEDDEYGAKICETYLNTLINNSPEQSAGQQPSKKEMQEAIGDVKKTCSVLGVKIAKCATAIRTQSEEAGVPYNQEEAFNDCASMINADDIRNTNPKTNENVFLEGALLDDIACTTGWNWLKIGDVTCTGQSHVMKYWEENKLDCILTVASYLIPFAGLAAKATFGGLKAIRAIKNANKARTVYNNFSRASKYEDVAKAMSKGNKSASQIEKIVSEAHLSKDIPVNKITKAVENGEKSKLKYLKEYQQQKYEISQNAKFNTTQYKELNEQALKELKDNVKAINNSTAKEIEQIITPNNRLAKATRTTLHVANEHPVLTSSGVSFTGGHGIVAADRVPEVHTSQATQTRVNNAINANSIDTNAGRQNLQQEINNQKTKRANQEKAEQKVQEMEKEMEREMTH